MKTIGIVGNPNCGKTTVFNALTGAKQHIGNWPGVTVEKKEGEFSLPLTGDARLVDLPGIYSLTATSEDEKAALGYVLSHEADLFINVIALPTTESTEFSLSSLPMLPSVSMVFRIPSTRTIGTMNLPARQMKILSRSQV